MNRVQLPMIKKWSICIAFLAMAKMAYCQQARPDTTITPRKEDLQLIDTTIDYSELFQDFDEFMDSILSPRSYFLLSVSANRVYYNFENKTSFEIISAKKMTYSPTLGYYHKSGLGITANSYVVNDGSKNILYQSGITGTYDYLQNRALATGFSYTRFFTNDSLSFYTTPLQNELYAYFVYRKWWVRPMLAISYGWGSREDYQQREELIQDLRLRRRGFTFINTKETISDLSLLLSVRHDFYWLDVFKYKDHIRFTPQLSFTAGTQKFGFNQSSSTYATSIRTGSNLLYNSDNVTLDDQLKFQPLSLTFYLRGEYSIGKVFLQPQLAMDYYFPATDKHFNTMFAVTAGIMF